MDCKALEKWVTGDRRICIPASLDRIPEDIHFLGLWGYIIEIPERLWDPVEILCGGHVREAAAEREYERYSEVIFKVLRKDGSCYYSPLSYQNCYGEVNEYIQTFDRDNDNGYSDAHIDEDLLRHYNTEDNTAYKVLARVCRLATPYKLSEENRENYSGFVKRNAIKGLKMVAIFDCPELFEVLKDCGALKKEAKDTVREELKKAKAHRCEEWYEEFIKAGEGGCETAGNAGSKGNVTSFSYERIDEVSPDFYGGIHAGGLHSNSDKTVSVTVNGNKFRVTIATEKMLRLVFKDFEKMFAGGAAERPLYDPLDVVSGKYSAQGSTGYGLPIYKVSGNARTLTPSQVLHRVHLFARIDELLRDPKAAEKLAEIYPKKKDGTFVLKRVLRIATFFCMEKDCSMHVLCVTATKAGELLVEIRKIAEIDLEKTFTDVVSTSNLINFFEDANKGSADEMSKGAGMEEKTAEKPEEVKAEKPEVKEPEKKEAGPGKPMGENWCLSAKANAKYQVKVRLSTGKSYEYYSRYPVSVGDVVVIGNGLPVNDQGSYKSNNTGLFGVVESFSDKVTLKKAHAVELDFVFTRNVDGAAVKECAKYLKQDDYEKNLQYGKHTSPVRPITYFVRRYLAAASILANKALADKASVALAKEVIARIPVLDERVLQLYWMSFSVYIDLTQVFVPETDVNDELRSLAGEAFLENESGCDGRDYPYDELLKDEKVREFIAKYSYLGAIAVMAGGGFENMKEAFLAEKPLTEMSFAEECKKIPVQQLSKEVTGSVSTAEVPVKEAAVKVKAESPRTEIKTEVKTAPEEVSEKAAVTETEVKAGISSDFRIDKNGILTEYRGKGPEVIIPEGVKKIGHVFSQRKNIKKVVIPKTVLEIEKYAFFGSAVEEVVFSEGLEVIGEATFYICKKLKTVKLPKTLCKIEKNAFNGTALTSIVIPGKVEKVKAEAFHNCKDLEKIVVEEGVSEIGYACFCDCKYADIYIPQSVKRMGDLAIYSSKQTTIHLVKGSYAETYAKNRHLHFDYGYTDGVMTDAAPAEVPEKAAVTETKEAEAVVKPEVMSVPAPKLEAKENMRPMNVYDGLKLLLNKDISCEEKTDEDGDRMYEITVKSPAEVEQKMALVRQELDREQRTGLAQIGLIRWLAENDPDSKFCDLPSPMNCVFGRPKKGRELNPGEEFYITYFSFDGWLYYFMSACVTGTDAEEAAVKAAHQRIAEGIEGKPVEKAVAIKSEPDAVFSGVKYLPGQEPAEIRKKMSRLFEKLDGAYPDRVVVSLNKNHKKWGEAVTDLYRQLGYPDGDAFLKAYGYIAEHGEHGRPSTVDPDAFISRLKELYPEGTSLTVGELQEAHPELQWNSLKNKANEFFGMPLAKYLAKEGIIVSGRGTGSSGSGKAEQADRPDAELPKRYESAVKPAEAEQPEVKQADKAEKEKSIGSPAMTVADFKKFWESFKEDDGDITLYRYLGQEEEVIIPTKVGRTSVTRIGDRSFDNNLSVKKVYIPEGIVAIGNGAFSNCVNLAEISIPDSLTVVGEGVFEGCNKLKKKVLFSTSNADFVRLQLDYCASKAFNSDWEYHLDSKKKCVLTGYHGTDLDVIVPASYKGCGVRIKNRCFFTGFNKVTGRYGTGELNERLAKIRSIKIPDTVKEIGDEAFCGCRSLQKLVISPKAKVGAGAFVGCYKLRDASKLFIQDEVLWAYIEDRTTMDDRIETKEKLEIPSGVKRIAEYALSEARFKKIVLPDGVVSIGKEALSNVELQEVVIPSSVTEIHETALGTALTKHCLIRGKAGSAAQLFARLKGMQFKEI